VIPEADMVVRSNRCILSCWEPNPVTSPKPITLLTEQYMLVDLRVLFLEMWAVI